MGTTRKVAIGLGIAGGALLAAWLLTGTRKRKTKDFVIRKAGESLSVSVRPQNMMVMRDAAV